MAIEKKDNKNKDTNVKNLDQVVENKDNKENKENGEGKEIKEDERKKKNKITSKIKEFFVKIKNVFGKTYKILKYILFIVLVLIICLFIARQYTKNVYPYFNFIKLNKQTNINDDKLLHSNINKIKQIEDVEQDDYITEDNDYEDFYDDSSEIITQNEYLMKQEILNNKLVKLENNILELQNIINNLQKNILELENSSPASNEANLQIVVLLYKIENIVHIGGDFGNYLEKLKSLTKNRTFIFENILELEKYRQQKSQQELKGIFFGEYESVLSKKNIDENKLKMFLNDNVKIRKIKNFKENIDDVDFNLYNIENSIEKFNYNEAINIIVGNKYESDFSGTLNALYEKNNVLSIVNKILNFVYGIGTNI